MQTLEVKSFKALSSFKSSTSDLQMRQIEVLTNTQTFYKLDQIPLTLSN